MSWDLQYSVKAAVCPVSVHSGMRGAEPCLKKIMKQKTMRTANHLKLYLQGELID